MRHPTWLIVPLAIVSRLLRCHFAFFSLNQLQENLRPIQRQVLITTTLCIGQFFINSHFWGGRNSEVGCEIVRDTENKCAPDVNEKSIPSFKTDSSGCPIPVWFFFCTFYTVQDIKKCFMLNLIHTTWLCVLKLFACNLEEFRYEWFFLNKTII